MPRPKQEGRYQSSEAAEGGEGQEVPFLTATNHARWTQTMERQLSNESIFQICGRSWKDSMQVQEP